MPSHSGKGSWVLVQELLERGEPSFVDELRMIDDADLLGALAAKWHGDRRGASRQLLFDYLNRPLNAFRHEALVKRLFKLAEQAGDDEVMARFLVLFDRSIRRVRRKKSHFETRTIDNRDAAHALIKQWEDSGAEHTHLYEWRDQFHVSGRWVEEVLTVPRGTDMPRGRTRETKDWSGRTFQISDLTTRLGLTGKPPRSARDLPEHLRKKLERFRLFSVHTRYYLRRRAWRYFRKLGRKHPERYIPAVVTALQLYEDADAADGLALLDNWSLMHLLFHFSPALAAKPHGWTLAEGHSLAELAPAPMFDALWRATPRSLLDLVKAARSRPVRQWAIRMIRRDPAAVLGGLALEELLQLLGHEDPEVVALAAEALPQTPGLDQLPVDRWLTLLETPTPAALEILCELMTRHVRPEQATLEQALRLARSRPLPVARLGLTWLQTKTPTSEADCRALLGLAEAQAELVRPELVRWARGPLSASPHFQVFWILEYLDSRHADVRAEGWTWLQEEERARDDVSIWQRLLESPYDDVRLKLVSELEKQVGRRDAARAELAELDPDLVRFLWASVLLNIHRGNRAKPVVVRQLVRRLERHPGEAPLVLPILAVALRSLRGPEWRAGLAGVVGLLERNPEMETVVREKVPQLEWG